MYCDYVVNNNYQAMTVTHVSWPTLPSFIRNHSQNPLLSEENFTNETQDAVENNLSRNNQRFVRHRALSHRTDVNTKERWNCQPNKLAEGFCRPETTYG